MFNSINIPVATLSLFVGFLGVFIAALISFIGVTLTNRAARQRLQLQLHHERDLKKNEREMDFRKDIFLSAAESINLGISLLTTLSDIGTSSIESLEKFHEKYSPLAKIQVIASIHTIEQLDFFSSELNLAHFQLMMKRETLMEKKRDLDILMKEIESFGIRRDHYLELIIQHHIEDGSRSEHLAKLQQYFDFEQKRVREAIDKHVVLEKILKTNQIQLVKLCISESARLAVLVAPVLIELRKELDLPLDLERYTNIVKTENAKQLSFVNSFIEESLANSKRAFEAE